MQLKRRNALAFKIGAIFAGACGSRTRGAPNPSFHTGAQQNECIEGTQQVQVAARKRRRLSGFLRKRSSGFNLRKWRMMKARSRWILRPRFRRILDVDETEKAQEEVELCKMRILMGGKCRPLNPSGVLHYDEEGILLPEDVLF